MRRKRRPSHQEWLRPPRPKHGSGGRISVEGLGLPPKRTTGIDEPIPGAHLAWHFLPSRPLGGDCFAVTPWGVDTLLCYMLDVSGHGVRAANRAAALAKLFSPDGLAERRNDRDPGQVLAFLNQRYPLTKAGQSFTIWLGFLSVPSGELRFSTAGHAGALVLRRGGSVERVSAPSFPIGFVSHPGYFTTTTVLRNRDRLLMLSDGLYDAQAPDGERWGLKRLERAAARHIQLPLDECVNALVAEARGWQGRTRFDDDAALVGLEIG